MTILAFPLGPMAQAYKALLISNPVAGIIVGAVALTGYAIYEETRKK